METNAPEFTTWLDEFFTAYYHRRPVNATFVGVHQYDDQLPDYSEQGAGDTLAEMESLLERLRSLPAEVLTGAESLDRKLAKGYLECQLWEYTSTHFHLGNPSLYTGEAIFGILSLFLTPFAPLDQRVESAIARMEAAAALLEQARANVPQAPLAWTERAIRECTGALAFFQDGVEWLSQNESVTDPRFQVCSGQGRVGLCRIPRFPGN